MLTRQRMESEVRKLGIYPGDLLVGKRQRGLVGAADCRLFDIAEFVDTLVAEIRSDAAAYLQR